jgi:hypothetical protein
MKTLDKGDEMGEREQFHQSQHAFQEKPQVRPINTNNIYELCLHACARGGGNHGGGTPVGGRVRADKLMADSEGWERVTSIYLAGKIAKGDWRYDLIGYEIGQLWDPGCQGEKPERWPVMTNAVLGMFDYTGPYFTENGGHGLGHGPNTHGCNDGMDAPVTGRQELMRLCMEAIISADIVFAWLDDLTAYGTLVEIGFAKAHGKFIVIGTPVSAPSEQDKKPGVWGDVLSAGGAYAEAVQQDMWFALQCGLHIPAASPVAALEEVKRWYPGQMPPVR